MLVDFPGTLSSELPADEKSPQQATATRFYSSRIQIELMPKLNFSIPPAPSGGDPESKRQRPIKTFRRKEAGKEKGAINFPNVQLKGKLRGALIPKPRKSMPMGGGSWPEFYSPGGS